MAKILLDTAKGLNDNLISLPKRYWNTSFFPYHEWHFALHTDDNKILFCTRSKYHGKAIYTPHNNNTIGEYFRVRLGLSKEEYITDDHLKEYGRDSIDFYKVDEESFMMDFSLTNKLASKKNRPDSHYICGRCGFSMTKVS